MSSRSGGDLYRRDAVSGLRSSNPHQAQGSGRTDLFFSINVMIIDRTDNGQGKDAELGVRRGLEMTGNLRPLRYIVLFKVTLAPGC